MSPPWMPFYVADYLVDTQHLNTQQHGAYFLLLMAAWSGGGDLPDDENVLRLITKLSPKEWRAHRDVLAAFFTIADGRWSQKRLRAEIVRALESSAGRRDAGARGAAKRWQSDGRANGPATGPATGNAIGPGNGKRHGKPVAGPMPGPMATQNSELRPQSPDNSESYAAARGRGSGAGALAVDANGEAQWAARLNGYKPGDFWMPNHWGPRPENAGCLAPEKLLVEWRTKHGVDPPKA